MAEHFIAGSGEYGCLYDQSCVYRSLDDAVESMAELFGLGRNRRRELKNTLYLDLNPRRDGASYVEIIPCDCAEPWDHDEMMAADDWEKRE